MIMNTQVTQPIEQVLDILRDISVCDRCLGRQFAWLSTSTTNAERGRSLKLTLSMSLESTYKKEEKESVKEQLQLLAQNGMFEPAEKLCDKYGIHIDPPSRCQLCDTGEGSVFDRIPSIVERAMQQIESVEFDSYLVGSAPIEELAAFNEEIRGRYELVHAEPLKSEFNRALGKALAEFLAKDVDFDRPDLIIFYDMQKDVVDLRINPVFIYGRYRKLERGIPQSRWDCKACRGTGCEKCNGTGRNYQDSVSEYIANPMLQELGGTRFKFHAAGREDIDVLMLGSGRPFVVEISKPKARHPNLEELTKMVNTGAKGKVEIENLEITTRRKLQDLKTSASDSVKEYHALIQCEQEVSEEALRLTEANLNGVVLDQRTPNRVSHRRSDLIRKKEVIEVKLSKKEPQILEAYFKVQGGTYIKELISGDEGRTTPSVTEFLQTQCTCIELEVIAVHS